MASSRQTYSADDFKKNYEECSNSIKSSKLQFECSTSAAGKSMYNISENLQTEDCESSNNEYSDTSSDEGTDCDKYFNSEDMLIAKLYREVVDDIMTINKLQESDVDCAISKMKQEIHQGHKKGFRKFEGIDFCKAFNRCGYLRRYATCHTGLVKKAIWRILLRKDRLCKNARDIIFGEKRKELKVVSLGGGPGNDLIGFCSALQDAHKSVDELDLKIVDVSQGWGSVFSSILRKAKTSKFGSLSELLKQTKIKTSFLQANLNTEKVFEDQTLSSILAEANIILMVKLISFLSDPQAEKLIQNVVDGMQVGGHLIFIDHPYDKDLFQRISSLDPIYHHYLKYETSFRPARYHCPSIPSAQAHVGVFEKQLFESTSSEDDESAIDEI